MYNEFLGVKITAYDDAEWRKIRMIQALCEIYNNDFVNEKPIEKIKSFHDHKGMLTVTWERRPNENDLQIVNFAWKNCDETDTEHYYISLQVVS
jgi:hypothetical protein